MDDSSNSTLSKWLSALPLEHKKNKAKDKILGFFNL